MRKRQRKKNLKKRIQKNKLKIRFQAKTPWLDNPFMFAFYGLPLINNKNHVILNCDV